MLIYIVFFSLQTFSNKKFFFNTEKRHIKCYIACDYEYNTHSPPGTGKHCREILRGSYARCRCHIQSNGTGHKYIIVTTGFGGITAIWQLLVGGKFIASLVATLNIRSVTHHRNKVGYNERLCGSIGVKPYA